MNDRPSFIPESVEGHPEEEPWSGPPPEELIAQAKLQPGAKTRQNGIKFQCPGCRLEGHDKSMDNAIVRWDGRWGCAVSPEHKSAIGQVLCGNEYTGPITSDEDDDFEAFLRFVGYGGL